MMAHTPLPRRDQWAVDVFKLQRERIAEVCADPDVRAVRMNRAKVGLFKNLLGSPNMFAALRCAGVLTSVGASRQCPPRCSRAAFRSDEDRAAQFYLVQRERIRATRADPGEREEQLRRAHDTLLRNLRAAAVATCPLRRGAQE